jgi:hypothetical protein
MHPKARARSVFLLSTDPLLIAMIDTLVAMEYGVRISLAHSRVQKSVV